MKTIVSFLGLLLLMGGFGSAQQQQYDSDARGFTVPGRTKARDHRGTSLGGPETASERNRHGDGAERFDTGID
jgi:hypothetical protein